MQCALKSTMTADFVHANPSNVIYACYGTTVLVICLMKMMLTKDGLVIKFTFSVMTLGEGGGGGNVLTLIFSICSLPRQEN